jgi:hypothetical protein
MTMLRRAWVCLLLILCTGCVMVPIPTSNTLLSGTEIKDDRAAFITPGNTRREDIIRQLGEPYADFPDLGILAYTWEMRADKILWAAAGGGGAAGGAIDVDREYSLLIAVDSADRVVTFEPKVRSQWFWSRETVREHAIKWAAAQDLAVPDPLLMMAGQVVPPGSAALYVYREGGFWDYPVMALPPEVRVDGSVLGWPRSDQYVPLLLAPGDHIVTVDSFPRQSRKPERDTVASLRLYTLPGQAQYVSIGIPQLTLHPQWIPALTVRSEDEAVPILNLMQPTPTTRSARSWPTSTDDLPRTKTVTLVVQDEVQTSYSQEGGRSSRRS